MLHPSLVDKNFHFYSIDLEGFQNQKSILPAHFPSTCQQSCRIFLLLWTFLQKCLFPICMHLQQWAVETLAQEENFWAIDLFSSTRLRLVNLARLLSKTWFHSALYQDLQVTETKVRCSSMYFVKCYVTFCKSKSFKWFKA